MVSMILYHNPVDDKSSAILKHNPVDDAGSMINYHDPVDDTVSGFTVAIYKILKTMSYGKE